MFLCLVLPIVAGGCSLADAFAVAKDGAGLAADKIAERQCGSPDWLRATERRAMFDRTGVVVYFHCPPPEGEVDARYEAAVRDMHVEQAVQDCITAEDSAFCLMQWGVATGRVQTNKDGSQSLDLGKLGTLRWYPQGVIGDE